MAQGYRILVKIYRCDSIYDIPSTTSRRSTSFGFGKKDIGIRDDKFIPPPATYTLNSEFEEKRSRGFSFGQGRDVNCAFYAGNGCNRSSFKRIYAKVYSRTRKLQN